LNGLFNLTPCFYLDLSRPESRDFLIGLVRNHAHNQS
jgi:hypothetical protein